MPTPQNTLTLLANAIDSYAKASFDAGMERQRKLDSGQISEGEGLFHHEQAKAESAVNRMLYELRSKIRGLEAAFNARTAAGPVGQSETSNVSTETVESVQKQGNPRFRLLDDAWNAVSRTEYGGPEQSFQRIGNLWQMWLDERCHIPNGVTVDPEDVAVMLMLMKVARLMSVTDHHDSIVDIAGYAACLAEIVEES